MRWIDEGSTWFAGRSGRGVAFAAVLLSGAVLAGCGDDDDAATTADEAPATETETGTETTDAGGDGAASGAEAVGVEIVDISTGYDPASVTVSVGDDVTWTNADSLAHTVTADDGTFDSGNLDGGAEFTFTAEEAGTFPYICEIHPGMQGELVVE